MHGLRFKAMELKLCMQPRLTRARFRPCEAGLTASPRRKSADMRFFRCQEIRNQKKFRDCDWSQKWNLGSWNLAILHWPRSLWGCWRPINFRALYYNSSGHFRPSSCTSRQAINFFGPFRFMTSDDLSGHWGQQFRGPWESLHLSWTTEICFFQRKMHSSMSCNTQKL